MNERPDRNPFSRIVPWIGKLSAGSAMALVTLATVQEVIAVAGPQGVPAALTGLLGSLFGDAVIGPTIERLLNTGGEAIPEELRAELHRLEEKLRQQDVQRAVAEMLRQQDAIARVTGTALQMHEDSAVRRIAEAVAYQTWAAADEVVQRLGDKFQQVLQDTRLQDLHVTVQAMMALLQRERGLIHVQQTVHDVRVDGDLTQIGTVGGNVVLQADTLTVVLPSGEDSAKAQRLADLKWSYLTRLAEQVGRLYLSQINPDAPEGVYLERIYVDSPTKLAISVEVQDWQVVDWWISQRDERQERSEMDEGQVRPRQRPADLGYETAALELLVQDVQQQIDAYRAEEQNYRYYNRWDDGSKNNVTTLVLQDIAAARNRLVVLGGPGSGKSTFVKHLALCLAGEQLGWEREARLEHIRRWLHGALTPVYLELRRFVGSKHFPEAPALPTVDGHLWPYICDELLGADLAEYAGSLRLELEHGRAVLILDGLDEVPYDEGRLADRQRQLQALARSLDDRYGSSRVIVASRPYAYEGWRLPGFEAVEIADFEDEHRLELARRLYCEGGLEPEAAEGMAERLVEELERVDDELKDRPLFLTLMATVFLYEGGGLPTNKGTLYRKSILLLLDRWVESKPGVRTLADILGVTGLEKRARVEAIYERLAALAYEVHALGSEGNNRLPEIAEEQLYKHLKPLGRHLVAELIRYLSENAGVLVSPGQNDEKDVFRFAHRSFQEYLAASHLVAECQRADRYDRVRGHIEGRPQIWREPCTLVGDVLVDGEHGRELWTLVDHLLGEEDEPETLAADSPRWWSAWLAARVVEEQEALHKKPGRGERAIRDALVRWLRQVMETASILEPQERAVCGRALGWLGDPRKGVAQFDERGVPLLDWVTVPAGEFWMGSDKEKDPQAYDDEIPGRLVYVDTFAIARYPVTYAQYEAFVHDTSAHPEGGYAVDRYWTAAGLAWRGEKRQPEWGWNDPDWHIANHPVIGMTWYETYAFCQWLSEKTDRTVTLPTETQWEYAARGTDGRIYPYGNEFDPNRGNTDATGIGRTSAVGLFPDPALPFGLLDMSGNVWEWCLTRWRDSYTESDEDNAPDGAERRVLRGGSFANGRNRARAAARFGLNPDLRLNDWGFRVVRLLPPSL